MCVRMVRTNLTRHAVTSRRERLQLRPHLSELAALAPELPRQALPVAPAALSHQLSARPRKQASCLQNCGTSCLGNLQASCGGMEQWLQQAKRCANRLRKAFGGSRVLPEERRSETNRPTEHVYVHVLEWQDCPESLPVGTKRRRKWVMLRRGGWLRPEVCKVM
jgi:hypothetical protein